MNNTLNVFKTLSITKLYYLETTNIGLHSRTVDIIFCSDINECDATVNAAMGAEYRCLGSVASTDMKYTPMGCVNSPGTYEYVILYMLICYWFYFHIWSTCQGFGSFLHYIIVWCSNENRYLSHVIIHSNVRTCLCAMFR